MNEKRFRGPSKIQKKISWPPKISRKNFVAPQNFGKKFRGPPKILWPPIPEKKRKPPKDTQWNPWGNKFLLSGTCDDWLQYYSSKFESNAYLQLKLQLWIFCWSFTSTFSDLGLGLDFGLDFKFYLGFELDFDFDLDFEFKINLHILT